MEFEWDLRKEEVNLEKHGVDFTEAAGAFADELGFAGYDQSHGGAGELRWFWFGRSDKGRILTGRYTHRGRVLRIVGAGAWREGKRIYDRSNK